MTQFAISKDGKDVFGKPYAKVEEVKQGTVLITDDGFTCMEDAQAKTVCQDSDGFLYIACDKGKHYLGCERDHGPNGDFYIGLYLEEKK